MNGRVVASERPGHSILEVPNPLGVVAVLSAFNFPVAVYGWNLALAFAAGNATLWKPAPSTPLCSIAVTKIVSEVLKKNGIPGAAAGLVTGGKAVGETVVGSTDVDMVSFTGSEAVGREVGKAVQARFGKVLLELGGNNGTLHTAYLPRCILNRHPAAVVMPDADLDMAVPAVFFGAVGTAGQRCTSTRRLYLHSSVVQSFLSRLESLYQSVRPGDPLARGTLLGPLHSRAAMGVYHDAIEHLHTTGAEILTGGAPYKDLPAPLDGGNFVMPTIAIPQGVNVKDRVWSTETFAPVLNVGVFDELEQAIEWNNGVPQVRPGPLRSLSILRTYPRVCRA